MVHPALKGLVEHLVIHAGLEKSVTGILHQIITNTVLSTIIGLILVEASQALWRKTKSRKGAGYQ